MKITNIKVFKTKRKEPVLAYANVVLDNKFIIRGITLLETEKYGRYISMPARRLLREEKSYRDICHPLNNDIREEFTKKIFEAYDKFIKDEE